MNERSSIPLIMMMISESKLALVGLLNRRDLEGHITERDMGRVRHAIDRINEIERTVVPIIQRYGTEDDLDDESVSLLITSIEEMSDIAELGSSVADRAATSVYETAIRKAYRRKRSD